MTRLALPVCLVLAVCSALPAATAGERPALTRDERVVLALLGMVGSGEPERVARARRLLAVQADRHKLRPLSLALGCEPASLRIFAAGALARLEDERAARPLLVRVLREEVPEVREAITTSLRERASPHSVHVLGKALWSRSASTRTRAAEALGRLGDELGLAYLVQRWSAHSGDFPRVYITQVEQVSYVQDFDVEVAATSFIADPLLGVAQQGFSHAVKVVGTEQVVTTREHAAWHRALVALARRDAGRSAAAWRRWWEANRERLLEQRAKRLSP